MKTLLLLTLLLSAAAWVSFQGESRATANSPSEIPLRQEPPLPAIRISAPKPMLAVPLTAEPRKPPSALQAAIESGDVCATARIINGPTNSEQIFEAYLGAINPSSNVLEIYGAKGPYFAKAATGQKYQSIAARTLWALKLAGLAYAANSVPENLAEAHAMLTELGKLEPGNGFYPLMRLSVESRLNYPKEKLLATAEEIPNSSKFDSHLEAISNELREASWANPAARYAYNNFYTPHMVKYYHVTAALRAVENFSGLARVGQLMTEAALHSTHHDWDADYDEESYRHGRILDPDGRYPIPSELVPDRSWPDGSYGPVVPTGANCDPAPYENFFFEQRESR